MKMLFEPSNGYILIASEAMKGCEDWKTVWKYEPEFVERLGF